MRLAKFKRRSEFEDPNELAKIGLRSHAFRQQVKVIGHQAIGVHLKPLPYSTFMEQRDPRRRNPPNAAGASHSKSSRNTPVGRGSWQLQDGSACGNYAYHYGI